MKLEDYAELGWYTVPLQGELKRLANGKKTLPTFPDNWKEIYAEEFNKKFTQIGGVITGPKSNIIAIDCDNEETYEIFKTLDPNTKAIFKSKGKKNVDGSEMIAGTFIYQYTPELEESFKVSNGSMCLDFYSTKGFVYLPTKANESKETWTEIPEIPEPSPKLITLIKSLKPVKLKVVETEFKQKQWKLHLSPQISKFVENKTVTKSLFKILTPKDFRDTQEYLAQNFLHPKQVAQGRGSEYLSKVSAILGADESVDEEEYTQAMYIINELFDNPMERKRLEATVIEPMIEERASVNGEVIWKYNKHWRANQTIIVTKLNSSLHIFYDMIRKLYYCVDIAGEHIHEFKKDTDMFTFLETASIQPIVRKELKTALPLVTVNSSPQFPFGFYGEDKGTFNTFIPTTALSIFKSPETYEKSYTYPKTILAFFEYLVPDNYMRNYLFKFLRRKFDTFDYSPVILYFLGASGSGKDLFVSLLELIIGSGAIAKPSAKEFIEMHNGWMLDKYFAQLDEYGDQLSRFDDQEVAKGKIKAYSGKPTVQIRQMRTDGFHYEHNITMIMTANRNPLTFDLDDRRIALFDCPTPLRFQPLVQEQGLETFVQQIFDEINDFAYWLRIERENATLEEYMTPPDTLDKKRLIAAKLSAGAQIAYYLSNCLFEDFEQLATAHDQPHIFASAQDDRIYEDDLFDLYMEMTENQGTKRGLTIAMKQFDKIPTSRNGIKAYWYKIPNLQLTATQKFTPIEGEFDGV